MIWLNDFLHVAVLLLWRLTAGQLSCHRFGDPVTANCSVQRMGILGWMAPLVRKLKTLLKALKVLYHTLILSALNQDPERVWFYHLGQQVIVNVTEAIRYFTAKHHDQLIKYPSFVVALPDIEGTPPIDHCHWFTNVPSLHPFRYMQYLVQTGNMPQELQLSLSNSLKSLCLPILPVSTLPLHQP